MFWNQELHPPVEVFTLQSFNGFRTCNDYAKSISTPTTGRRHDDPVTKTEHSAKLLGHLCNLTYQLSGRPEAIRAPRVRMRSLRRICARPCFRTTSHGPLQRLLGIAPDRASIEAASETGSATSGMSSRASLGLERITRRISGKLE